MTYLEYHLLLSSMQVRSRGKEYATRRECTTRRCGHASLDKYIEDVITSPLPAFAREPLLVVIDNQEVRRAWVAQLLTFAHYQVYVPSTAGEALIWFTQHLIAPQAILFGDLNPVDQSFTQRLFERVVIQNGRQIPVISLVDFSETRPTSNPRGCSALLEILWLEVPRSK
jgi:hypothetical protein